MSPHHPDDGDDDDVGEGGEHILSTAEPFHPARDPDDDDDSRPLPPIPVPEGLEEPDPEPEPEPEVEPEVEEGEEPEALAEPEPEPEVEVESEPESPPELIPEPEPEPPLTFTPPPPTPLKPRRSLLARLVRASVLVLLFVLVIGPIGMTLIYRFVPPPLTALMVIRAVEGNGLDHRWRSLNRISPALPRAVIAAEDARFCEHHGFDFEAMQKAMAANEKRPNRIRGGSTISQQTAKNVFLWPARSYVRKGFEAWFTVLIETLWGKRRIMEVYLNSIEWGPGVYGAEAAARHNFGIGADQLNAAQAARLAAILPRPLKWNAQAPGRYVAKRSRRIGAASGTVRRDGLADCIG